MGLYACWTLSSGLAGLCSCPVPPVSVFIPLQAAAALMKGPVNTAVMGLWARYFCWRDSSKSSCWYSPRICTLYLLSLSVDRSAECHNWTSNKGQSQSTKTIKLMPHQSALTVCPNQTLICNRLAHAVSDAALL